MPLVNEEIILKRVRETKKGGGRARQQNKPETLKESLEMRDGALPHFQYRHLH
jgi:hypothetical protein